jgi:D-alanyl-D-alanine carboxypeptidase
MDPRKNKILFSKKAEEIREMASLTKIMTCVVSLQLAADLKLNIHKTWFRVSQLAANIIGTSANLTENQRVTIHDLLYGLMLPSGNDAAVTLAEGFTELLLKARQRPNQGKSELITKSDISKSSTNQKNSSWSYFVKEMNSTAMRLHMKTTKYTNPHGLSDKANHSTASELA